jgi:ferredoxin
MVKVTKKEVVEKPQVLSGTLADKGFFLEKACGGRGICGSCKCKKVKGEVHYLRDAIASFDHETELLPCISVPKTDAVVIEVLYA